MKWNLKYLPEAVKDLKELSGNQRIQVIKAIDKVLSNPLPASEGGYGKPLGSRSEGSLAGFLKIKLLSAGIRVVYKLVQTDTEMLVIVIGARADSEVYDLARSRIEKHNL